MTFSKHSTTEPVSGQQNPDKPKIYSGWWMILSTGIISGLGLGFYGSGISVFFKDLAADLGISRASTSLATGIGRLEGGIISPFIGWLSDRYGSRWIIFSGTFLGGVGLFLMYFIQSVWSYIVVWGVLIGFGLNIGLTLAVDKSINDWFVKKRGLASGTKFALIGIICVALVPTVTVLVTNFGWRITCLIWGIVLMISSLLLLVFVKQGTPEVYGLLPDGDVPQYSMPDELFTGSDSDTKEIEQPEQDFNFKQAIRGSAFWMIFIAFCAQTVSITGFDIHFIPFLTDNGIDRSTAGAMMGLMLFCTIPCRFIAGAFSDRIPKEKLQYLLAGVFLILALGFSCYLLSGGIVSIYIMIIFFGIGYGGSTPLLVITTGRFFGRKAFGLIIGSLIALKAPIALIAPVFTGWVYDRSGNYDNALFLFVCLNLLTVVLMLLAKPSELPS